MEIFNNIEDKLRITHQSVSLCKDNEDLRGFGGYPLL